MPTKLKQTFPEKVPLEAIAGFPSPAVGVTAKLGFVIKQGDVVGKISASSKYRRRTRAAVGATAFATNSLNGSVDDASVFAVGDVLKNAAGVTIGTIQSIDLLATPDAIVLTGNAAVAVATGANVFGSDGSEVSQGISDEETDGTVDVPISVLIGGKLKESLLRGLDSTAKTELAGASVAGGVFKF